jgi:glycosyltransferase involved in cell wall biosynthesis
MARSLYICYFGVREALVQTQVLPYLRELVKGGHEIALLTFEPLAADTNARVDKETIRVGLLKEGIEWDWLRYHKRPSVPATLFDIMNGIRAATKIARRKSVDIFHVRGHLPAPIGVIVKKICGGKLLFDIRGFMPEEYVDAGIWEKSGAIYKTFKRIERWVLKDADGFVVLTEKARQVLFPESAGTGLDKLRRPVEVIPCCVDLSKYAIDSGATRHGVRRALKVEDKYVVAYVGSFGGFYMTDAMLDFLTTFKSQRPDMFAMVLTQREQEKISSALEDRGFKTSEFLVKGVPPNEIARYLSAADVAMSFIKPTYSKQSSSPTKIAEYLAAGLPVISNKGVGDLDQLLEENRVGALVNELTPDGYLRAINEVIALGEIGEKCREVALREFNLTSIGGPRYRRIYERLLRIDG